jgi:small subunit ribosomal protein S8
MLTDPIADYLTRIRNAQMAQHQTVSIPASNLKKKITEILYEQGYILKYKFEDSDGPQGTIYIALKYNQLTKRPVIRELGRISRPGLRNYVKADELPKIINGLGVAVVSTSKGVITDKKARELNVGGEVLCYVL